MSLRINNNIAAINALRNLGNTTLHLNKALQRLSSGLRINVAADDPAGLIISEQLRGQISSLRAASRNVSEANNFFNIGERGLEEVNSLLVSMRALAVHAANGATSDDQRTADNLDYQTALTSLRRIFDTTCYAGDIIFNVGEVGDLNDQMSGWTNITGIAATNTDANGVLYASLDATTGVVTFYSDAARTTSVATSAPYLTTGAQTQTLAVTETVGGAGPNGTIDVTASGGIAGAWTLTDDTSLAYGDPTLGVRNFLIGEQASTDDKVSFSLSSWDTIDDVANSGGGVTVTDLTTAANAELAIAALDATADQVSLLRGSIGAVQKNTFETRQRTIAVQIEAVTNSESNIRDANMAEETTNFTKYQILVQAGTAVLAQANVISQNVLQLLG